jgi:choline dehydrogenase
LPYFNRAETYLPQSTQPDANAYHGASGPIQVSRPGIKHPLALAFVEAGTQAGYPYTSDSNGAQREGIAPIDVTIGRGIRSSTSRAYLAPARSRANLQVITHAHATRVVLEGQRAVGVEFVQGKTKETRVIRAEREVILTAGAINSPQLLLLSGIGDPAHLAQHNIAVRHALPGVGANLQDHLAVVVKFAATKPVSLMKYFNPLHGALAMINYLALRKGPLADPGMEVCAFLKSNPDISEADVKMILVMALYANNGRTLTTRHGFAAHTNVIRTIWPTSTIAVSRATVCASRAISSRNTHSTFIAVKNWNPVMHCAPMLKSMRLFATKLKPIITPSAPAAWAAMRCR